MPYRNEEVGNPVDANDRIALTVLPYKAADPVGYEAPAGRTMAGHYIRAGHDA
ncbi:MAG: hypothetical protein M3071_15055 [Actinomycetota bacterium]|nr:hypothetical protein [Actinomycetota bacterium]